MKGSSKYVSFHISLIIRLIWRTKVYFLESKTV